MMGLFTIILANVDSHMITTLCCRGNMKLRDAFSIAGVDVLEHIKVNGEECSADKTLAECGVKHGCLSACDYDAFIVTHSRRL